MSEFGYEPISKTMEPNTISPQDRHYANVSNLGPHLIGLVLASLLT
jgi:hypothetical protein